MDVEENEFENEFENEVDEEAEETGEEEETVEEEPPTPPPKRRGRPPKVRVEQQVAPVTPKKRGRPPKPTPSPAPQEFDMAAFTAAFAHHLANEKKQAEVTRRAAWSGFLP